MGFLGDIKKLIFGAKSVTKSAADKAVDYGKDKGGDLLESADDLLGKAKDKAGDLGSTIVEKGGDLYDKAKDKAGDLADAFSGGSDDAVIDAETLKPDSGTSMADKAGSIAENVGGKILKTGSNLAEKAGNVAENVGGKIIDASAPYVEKAGDVAEDVGGKIMDAAGSMMDKAKELGGNLMDKTNDLVDKANEAAAKDALENPIDEAKSWDERLSDHVKGKDILDQKDPPIGYDKLDESLLEDKGSFWAKAEKFADGNYSGETKKPTPPPADENDIFANTEERQKQIEENVDKEPFKGEVKGFKDNDDDGDPVIDDAILDED